MKVILHYPGGRSSRARRSPDGHLNEATYTRKISQLIKAELSRHNLNTSLITDSSIKRITAAHKQPQSTRLRNQLQSANLLVSIRLNQSLDDGIWHQSKGWTSIENHPQSTKPSIGQLLTRHALQNLKHHAVKSPNQQDSLRYINHTAILQDVPIPSVITYNLYLDHKENARFLESEQAIRAIVRLHTDAILEYAQINE